MGRSRDSADGELESDDQVNSTVSLFVDFAKVLWELRHGLQGGVVLKLFSSMKTVPVTSPSLQGGSRLELVDALRGSALMGILLLHSIEHWDFTKYPANPPAWLKPFNTVAHDAGFFLFGGKSYAVFALMFGVSFFFMFESWSRRGVNFFGRFLWRLAVLAVFGYINGIVYCGDFLLVIAILGVPMVFLNRLGNRALTWVSILLVLQLPTLCQLGRVTFDAGYQIPRPLHWGVYGQLSKIYAADSFWDFVRINLGLGQLARLEWTYETGRYTQMLGLFVWGLLMARSGVLWDAARCRTLALRAVIFGVIGFAIVYPAKLQVADWKLAGMSHYTLNSLVTAYCNLAQLAIWVGGFMLLFQWSRGRTVLRVLAPFGRMSLSNYVVQGLIGVPLFYGFGLALFRWFGPFYSVLVGVAMLAGQIAFSHFWLKRFSYGPLEWLWRALTFGNFSLPLRKTVVAPARAGELVTAN